MNLSITLLCEEFKNDLTVIIRGKRYSIWHDIDDDGQADYKATYVFKDGKLHQLNKSHATQNELGYWIRRR